MECKYYYKGEKIVDLLSPNKYQCFLSRVRNNPTESVEQAYEFVTNGGIFGAKNRLCKHYYKGKSVKSLLCSSDYSRFMTYIYKHKGCSVEEAYEYVKNGGRYGCKQHDGNGLYYYEGEKVIDLLTYKEYIMFACYLYKNPEKTVKEAYEYVKNYSVKKRKLNDGESKDQCIYYVNGKRVIDLLDKKQYARFLAFKKNHPELTTERCFEFITKSNNVKEVYFKYKIVYEGIPVVAIAKKYNLSINLVRYYCRKNKLEDLFKTKGIEFKVEDFENEKSKWTI